jgi:hypothetical protein
VLEGGVGVVGVQVLCKSVPDEAEQGRAG